MPALLHLQAHSHGFQPVQTFLYHLLRHAQMAAHSGTKFPVALHSVGQRLVGLQHHGAVLEQEHLLRALLLHRVEVLLMCRTQASEDTYRGLYDALQGLHLTWLTDTSLEDGHLAVLVQCPHAQRHAYLRVVTARRARYGHVGREHLVEPLLDHGLAVAARNAYDGDVELFSVALGKALQGRKGVGHQELHCSRQILLQGTDHEGTHATVVEVLNVAVAVATFRADGKEQGGLRETKATAIRKQPLYLCVALPRHLGTGQ